jgi:hypothetical protein
MIAVLNWSLTHWWVFLWLSVLGVFEGVRDFFLGVFAAFASIGERRHQRRMKELKLQARIASGAVAVAPKPGQCVHRNVTAVISTVDDELRGWLCKSCDERLPANWAVRAEDL